MICYPAKLNDAEVFLYDDQNEEPTQFPVETSDKNIAKDPLIFQVVTTLLLVSLLILSFSGNKDNLCKCVLTFKFGLYCKDFLIIDIYSYSTTSWSTHIEADKLCGICCR